MGEKTSTTPFNPHKEEDEGYLAAEAGRIAGRDVVRVWRRSRKSGGAAA